MRFRKSRFELFALAFLLGSASVRAQLPPETTQPPAAGNDSTIKATLAEPQQPAPTPAAGTVKENPKDGLKYVWIPPGTFMMGCSPADSNCYDSEKPSHQVTITKGFWMGQTLVTVAAYQRFVSATGRQMPSAPHINKGWANQNMPIVNVNWDDSQAYCQWSGGRLPTEAEWEYAARAGNPNSRYGPLDEVAWYADNSGRERLDSATIWNYDNLNYGKRMSKNGDGTHDVGQKRANGFGLYDTLGNVWEWVNDWYDANYYQNSPSQDPTGPSRGQNRVLRGGSWLTSTGFVRVSYRGDFGPHSRYYVDGLRCVGEASATPKATLAEAERPAPAPAAVAKPSAPPAPAPAPRAEVPRHMEDAPIAGTVRENTKDRLKYVWIPPGTFMMGCSPGDSECEAKDRRKRFQTMDEKPPHQVTLTKGFWIGQTVVTVAAYQRFAAATGRQMPAAPAFNAGWTNQNMPIVNVTWDEAQAYCQWSGGRLPTEAEWEYAARAGSTESRYGLLDEIAWYADNSGRQHLDSEKLGKEDQQAMDDCISKALRQRKSNFSCSSPNNFNTQLSENGNAPHEVGQKRANGLGLYDTLGNVWEWVNDWLDWKYYQHSPSSDPAGPATGQRRVERGGSWLNPPGVVRVSSRNGGYPNEYIYTVGLRCAADVAVTP